MGIAIEGPHEQVSVFGRDDDVSLEGRRLDVEQHGFVVGSQSVHALGRVGRSYLDLAVVSARQERLGACFFCFRRIRASQRVFCLVGYESSPRVCFRMIGPSQEKSVAELLFVRQERFSSCFFVRKIRASQRVMFCKIRSVAARVFSYARTVSSACFIVRSKASQRVLSCTDQSVSARVV